MLQEHPRIYREIPRLNHKRKAAQRLANSSTALLSQIVATKALAFSARANTSARPPTWRKIVRSFTARKAVGSPNIS